MIINHNIAALNTYRQLSVNNTATSKSLEKLSSGYRINRAGDDAAGLAISEKMRSQIRGLNQAIRNAQDGISLIQTAEGALTETHSMLQRMRELAVQAANGTNTDADLEEIQKEIDQLIEEIDRIARKTEFNTKTLLDGSLGVKADDGSVTIADLARKGIHVSVSGIKAGETLTFTVDEDDDTITVNADKMGVSQTINLDDVTQVPAGTTIRFDAIGLTMTITEGVVGQDPDSGEDIIGDMINLLDNLDGENIKTIGTEVFFQIGANQNSKISINIGSMLAEDLGTDTGTSVANIKGVDVTVKGAGFDTNILVIDKAIAQVSAQRSQLGAYQNRLEHTINNLGTSAENLTAAESRIRDVDMAKEMMEFTKNVILQQAAQTMLAHANQQPQSVLDLLR
ncbi:MAG: flagellin [Clostridiaceae bacterium]|nr:flagellin [Clostridiaceae bacterium]